MFYPSTPQHKAASLRANGREQYHLFLQRLFYILLTRAHKYFYNISLKY